MAIAHPASSQAGSQPESNKKPKSQPETHVDAGTEMEVAPPAAAPTVAPDAISRGRRKHGNLEPEATAKTASGGPSAPLVIAGVDEAAELSEASESSATHLGGSSAAD